MILTSKGDINRDLPNFPYSVALTFDDGPHPYYTEALLKLLYNEGVRATFFVVGKQAEKYPQLVEMINTYGHEIGNHTYSHRDLTRLSRLEAIAEIEKTSQLLKKIIKKDVRLLRPPGGNINHRLSDFIDKMGYKIVLWDINTNDLSKNVMSDMIYSCVLDKVKDGDIVLFHSGSWPTFKILPKILNSLKLRGYKFVTVSELLKRKKIHG